MSMRRGELFSEIGQIVFDAHKGEVIDLVDTAEKLASRYASLGLSADTIAHAIARSSGAIGISLAMVEEEARKEDDDTHVIEPEFAVLPSGLRIAMLS